MLSDGNSESERLQLRSLTANNQSILYGFSIEGKREVHFQTEK